MELAGAHASSSGTQHDHFTSVAPVTDPVCDGSSGALCLDVLYADANATDDGTTSHSDSDSGLLRVCLGGTGDSTDTTCDGPGQGTVGGSSTQADRNQRTGRTTAQSGTGLADVCLSDPTGSAPTIADSGSPCAFGIDALSSQGQSDSGGAQPTASRGSSVAGVSLFGQSVTDSQILSMVPDGCLVPGLLCVYTNQGETYIGPGSLAGHAQEALKLEVLPGVTLTSSDPAFRLLGGRTETLVHNDGGEAAPVVADVEAGTPGHARPAVVAGVDAVPAAAHGQLPNTGGPSLGLLALALLGIGVGSMLIAVNRSSRLLAQAG